MADSIFVAVGEGRFRATAHARGPWDPQALHGGAPAALITRACEREQPAAGLSIARLGFEFLKPIPLDELTLRTELVRKGRRVQELAAELAAGDEVLCRASALRVTPVPAGVPVGTREPAEPLAGPERGEVKRFALNKDAGASMATSGMQMSWLSDPGELGAGKVWMRLRQPILPHEPASPLVRLAAAADFANGVSAALAFERYLFINADLTIHLWRAPQGEWIGLDARTLLLAGGVGTTETVLHDTNGAVGRAFQTLVVQPR